MTASVAVAMVTFGTFDALSFAIASGLIFMLLGCAGAALRLVRSGIGSPATPPGRFRSSAPDLLALPGWLTRA